MPARSHDISRGSAYLVAMRKRQIRSVTDHTAGQIGRQTGRTGGRRADPLSQPARFERKRGPAGRGRGAGSRSRSSAGNYTGAWICMKAKKKKRKKKEKTKEREREREGRNFLPVLAPSTFLSPRPSSFLAPSFPRSVTRNFRRDRQLRA